MWSSNHKWDWILITSCVVSNPAPKFHLSPACINQLFGFTRMPTLRWNVIFSKFIRIPLSSISMGGEHKKHDWVKGEVELPCRHSPCGSIGEFWNSNGPSELPRTGLKWLSLYAPGFISHWMWAILGQGSSPQLRQSLKEMTSETCPITTLSTASCQVLPSWETSLWLLWWPRGRKMWAWNWDPSVFCRPSFIPAIESQIYHFILSWCFLKNPMNHRIIISVP